MWKYSVSTLHTNWSLPVLGCVLVLLGGQPCSGCEAWLNWPPTALFDPPCSIRFKPTQTLDWLQFGASSRTELELVVFITACIFCVCVCVLVCRSRYFPPASCTTCCSTLSSSSSSWTWSLASSSTHLPTSEVRSRRRRRSWRPPALSVVGSQQKTQPERTTVRQQNCSDSVLTVCCRRSGERQVWQ